MISSELVQVRWAIVVGRKKRQFQTANLLEVDPNSESSQKKNTLQVVMFQNVLMDLKISKEKKRKREKKVIQCLLESLCPFKKELEFFCVFPISYTHKHVISYKCKYVLFHLNMLRLFQEINKGANMSMQKNNTYIHIFCIQYAKTIFLFLLCYF